MFFVILRNTKMINIISNRGVFLKERFLVKSTSSNMFNNFQIAFPFVSLSKGLLKWNFLEM